MQGFIKIKTMIGKKVLANLLKKKSKRIVKFCNINEANSFGLLCVVKEEKDFKKIIGLIKY